ncbi:MAG: AIR synthase-related protein [Patescibacteria group bacterium]|nr:AIR synthase-related protein [Patescibacteria group bacterium]
MSQSEYAKAGVDYVQMEPFKQYMVSAGRKTLKFPEKRGVFITEEATGAHGAVFEYRGNESHRWCQTQEDLGNKNWIAEWMYQFGGNPSTGSGRAGARTYYDSIAIDTAMMTVNDVIAQGALPVVFTDQIEASDSAWYSDENRARDLAAGFLKICEEVGMAMPAGESASVKYIVNPKPPVKMVATLSGCTTGIIAPKENLVTGKKLAPGDRIIAATSSGVHSNGISLLIKKALELPDQFLTKLPNGKTLGEEILIPTRSYVALIETLLTEKVNIHALLPGTGDGVGKLAFDKRQYSYRIHSWVPVPPVMQFVRGLGIEMKDCLKTFNWGGGYYVFVPKEEVARTLALGKKSGYDLAEVGVVEEGDRRVFFEPEKITLGGPGEG